MAVTTTPSISWLLPKLKARLPEVAFVEGEAFAWLPHKQEVTYNPHDTHVWQLLHEAGHAICGHSCYRRDIELLGYEVEAWSTAEQLADELDVTIPHAAIDDNVDTYRDWLHARSQCVSCAQTGVQVSSDTYRCLHCPARWQVNDGRQCGLRRVKL